MQVYKIDSNGHYVEPVIVNNEYEMTEDMVSTQPPQSLYRAKWTGTEWVEDMSQQEIDDIKNQPKSPTEKERLESAEQAIIMLMMEG